MRQVTDGEGAFDSKVESSIDVSAKRHGMAETRILSEAERGLVAMSFCEPTKALLERTTTCLLQVGEQLLWPWIEAYGVLTWSGRGRV